MGKTYVHKTIFYSPNTSLTVINLTNILAQITELYLKKKCHYFIKEIHTQFMKYFKQEPTNLLDILNQAIWYNNRIKTGKNYLINNRLEHRGIPKIKDILDEKCDFIDQSKINLKYKVNISFLQLIYITFCIPKSLKTSKHVSSSTSKYSH